MSEVQTLSCASIKTKAVVGKPFANLNRDFFVRRLFLIATSPWFERPPSIDTNRVDHPSIAKNVGVLHSTDTDISKVSRLIAASRHSKCTSHRAIDVLPLILVIRLPLPAERSDRKNRVRREEPS